MITRIKKALEGLGTELDEYKNCIFFVADTPDIPLRFMFDADDVSRVVRIRVFVEEIVPNERNIDAIRLASSVNTFMTQEYFAFSSSKKFFYMTKRVRDPEVRIDRMMVEDLIGHCIEVVRAFRSENDGIFNVYA